VTLELGEREDVEQLDGEAVRTACDELRDAVLLLEAEDELLAGVVGHVELLEPKRQRRRLLARDEEQPRLDVVRAAEVVTFAQVELPVRARRDPVLERGRMDAQSVIDLDLDGCVRPLFGRLTGLNRDRCDGGPVPA